MDKLEFDEKGYLHFKQGCYESAPDYMRFAVALHNAEKERQNRNLK